MDIGSYRLNERVASAVLPSWQLKAAHNPHIFQSAGFPVRVESTDELVSLLDTMHETRFRLFIDELGGLSEGDIEVLVKAAVNYCLFFRTNFQREKIPLPLSTLVAHLALAKKLRGLGARRILEFGPGCGYLSFFLRDWNDLANYTQVETTESFYVLQNLVNRYLFAHQFKEHAQSELDSQIIAPIMTTFPHNTRDQVRPQVKLSIDAVCHHYPWWKAAAVANERFDVVTANAMLNELSEDAFRQYVWLIDKALALDGALLVQCIGGGPLPFELIFRALMEIGLAPVVMVMNTGSVGDKKFALPNLLFVRQRHPLFAKYATGNLTLPRFDTRDVLVRAVYLSGGQGRDVGMDELAAMVSDRVQQVCSPSRFTPEAGAAEARKSSG